MLLVGQGNRVAAVRARAERGWDTGAKGIGITGVSAVPTTFGAGHPRVAVATNVLLPLMPFLPSEPQIRRAI